MRITNGLMHFSVIYVAKHFFVGVASLQGKAHEFAFQLVIIIAFHRFAFLLQQLAKVLGIFIVVDHFVNQLMDGFGINLLHAEGLLYLDATPFGEVVFIVDEGTGVAYFIDEVLLHKGANDGVGIAFKAPLEELLANVGPAVLTFCTVGSCLCQSFGNGFMFSAYKVFYTLIINRQSFQTQSDHFRIGLAEC